MPYLTGYMEKKYNNFKNNFNLLKTNIFLLNTIDYASVLIASYVLHITAPSSPRLLTIFNFVLPYM